jgi:hypothetical protein
MESTSTVASKIVRSDRLEDRVSLFCNKGKGVGEELCLVLGRFVYMATYSINQKRLYGAQDKQCSYICRIATSRLSDDTIISVIYGRKSASNSRHSPASCHSLRV